MIYIFRAFVNAFWDRAELLGFHIKIDIFAKVPIMSKKLNDLVAPRPYGMIKVVINIHKSIRIQQVWSQ